MMKDTATPRRPPVVDSPAMRVLVTIDGMLAVHARQAVFMALGAVEGITRAEVELGRAELEHDGRASEAAIRSAIEAVGFRVAGVRELPRATGRELPMFEG